MPYRSLSDAHTAVMRERALERETPIFARMVGRVMGTPVSLDYAARLDFAGWYRPALVDYIRRWGPQGQSFQPGRRNLRALRKVAEDVRDWRDQPTRYPEDSDLIVHLSGRRA